MLVPIGLVFKPVDGSAHLVADLVFDDRSGWVSDVGIADSDANVFAFLGELVVVPGDLDIGDVDESTVALGEGVFDGDFAEDASAGLVEFDLDPLGYAEVGPIGEVDFDPVVFDRESALGLGDGGKKN